VSGFKEKNAQYEHINSPLGGLGETKLWEKAGKKDPTTKLLSSNKMGRLDRAVEKAPRSILLGGGGKGESESLLGGGKLSL